MYSIREIENSYPPNQRAMQRNIFREYLQYHILQAISRSSIAQKLSFLGGTALRVAYGNPRFSEDLDFDNFDLAEGEFTMLSEEVKQFLEEEGMIVEIQLAGKNAFRCNVRFPKILFDNGLSPLQGEKVLIQIDSTAHGFQYTPEVKNFSRFETNFLCPVTPLSLLFSQKINAALNRPRSLGRDYFDLSFIIAQGVKPNYEYLDFKLQISSPDELRKRIVEKLDTLDLKALTPDVGPYVYETNQLSRIELFREQWLAAEL